MRIRPTTAAALLALALTASAVRAQDGDTPIDRVIQRLEARLQVLRARAQTADSREDIRELEEALKDAHQAKANRDRAGTGGGTGGGGDPAPPGGGGAGGGFGGGGFDRFLEGAFRDVEVTEPEKAACMEQIRPFYTDWTLAKDHKDDASKKLLRDDLEKRIERTVPKKKANPIMVNIDRGLRWIENPFGRR
jgi:hypothetical protein